MFISNFNYFKPNTIQKAINFLNSSVNGALLAGGTDLLVEIKQGLRQHDDIISLLEIEDLKSISEDENYIYVGATVTHDKLNFSTIIRNNIPALADAASKIGSVQIRNKGTIVGNLCTAASCCDTGPILIALNASVEIMNIEKTRTVLIKDFLVFHKKTILKKGDIITRIIIPKPEQGVGLHFEKYGLRESLAVSVASVAVMLKIENNICSNACIVIGAVAPTPKISENAGNVLIGKNISEFIENSTTLLQAGKISASDARPLNDIRGSKEYRKNILIILTQRAIIKAKNAALKKIN